MFLTWNNSETLHSTLFAIVIGFYNSDDFYQLLYSLAKWLGTRQGLCPFKCYNESSMLALYGNISRRSKPACPANFHIIYMCYLCVYYLYVSHFHIKAVGYQV